MTTKILMSFAMANHGARFAHWLRNELMKHYELADVDDVYMDCAVARMRQTQVLENSVSATFERDAQGAPVVNAAGNQVVGNAQGQARAVGVTYVMPDMRFAEFSAGRERIPGNQQDSINIGASWLDWNQHFTTAMGQATVVVFCYTPEFAASQWCLQEWNQYIDQVAVRPALRGVGLDFGGRTPFFVNQPEGFIRLCVQKKVTVLPGTNIFAWEPGDYTLSDSDLELLTDVIGGVL